MSSYLKTRGTVAASTTVLGHLLVAVLMCNTATCVDKRYDHHMTGTSMVWARPYNPRAVIHNRFQATRDGRVILASPRFRPGVPFTLGMFRVTAATRATVEPEVRPLPSVPKAHWIAGGNCSLPLLINVVDLYLEDNGIVLWLLDVGVVDTMTDQPKQLAPAKIVRLGIDKGDGDDDVDENDPKAYKTFSITSVQEGPSRSCLQYILAFRSPTENGGHYSFVSDAGRSAVVVLNTETGVQWSIDFPERQFNVDKSRGVMFMVLLRKSNGRTGLYVTFMSGIGMFTVDLEHLDHCIAAGVRPAIVEVGRKPYPITVLGSDAGSRMFFRRPTENEIWSWDVNDRFRLEHFRLVSRGRDCRAPVHVAPGYDDFVFVLKNNFADYVNNKTGSLGAYSIVQSVSALRPPPTCATSATTVATTIATETTEGDCTQCPP